MMIVIGTYILISMSLQDYDAQFALPHTGIVYTPPTYSDHVGVSLLLKLQVCSLMARLQHADDFACVG